MLFVFKMFLKASDLLSEGVNVSVEHWDGHGAFIFLCVDTGASSGNTQHAGRNSVQQNVLHFQSSSLQPQIVLKHNRKSIKALTLNLIKCDG